MLGMPLLLRCILLDTYGFGDGCLRDEALSQRDFLLTCWYRGPEVETWFGAEEGEDPAVVNDWGLLPFMALSDGAHA